MEPIYLPRHRLDVDEMIDIALKKGRRRLIALSCAGGILAGLILYFLFGSSGDPNAGLIATIAGVGVAVLSFVMYRQQFRKIYRRPGQRAMFDDRTVIFDAERVRIEYANGMFTSCPWKAIVKAEWTPKLLLLFLTDTQFLIVPRRTMDTAIEKTVAGLIDAGLKTRAQELPKAPVI